MTLTVQETKIPDAPHHHHDHRPSHRWHFMDTLALLSEKLHHAHSHQEDQDELEEARRQQKKRTQSVSLDATEAQRRRIRPTLKRSQSTSAVARRLAHYMDAIGIHTTKTTKHKPHHDNQQDQEERHVHFVDEHGREKIDMYERPTTTADEKALYHYSAQELQEIARNAKTTEPSRSEMLCHANGTIFQQGFLLFPDAPLHRIHPRRYYCLLKSHQVVCFASPAHAIKPSGHPKAAYTISQVIDCFTMSRQQQIATWGAHLPSMLPLLFFIVQPNGERILLAAETRCQKRNWMRALRKLNYDEFAVQHHIV